MLTTLIFSLVLAHNNLSRKDPREYKCRVENASEISGSVRSLTVVLPAPGIAVAKGELSRTPKVITLECFGLQNPVQVNVLYWEKVQRDLTNQTAETCALQSLEVTASADRKPAPGHTCLLLTHHQKSLQRKFIFSKTVFLAGTLNYITSANLPKLEVSGKGLTVPHVDREKQPVEKIISSSNDKDMLNRLKISIVMKVFIACILLAFAISYIVFCVCEVPCPCLCAARIKSLWSSSRSWLVAAWILVKDRTAMLLNKLLKDKEQKALEDRRIIVRPLQEKIQKVISSMKPTHEKPLRNTLFTCKDASPFPHHLLETTETSF